MSQENKDKRRAFRLEKKRQRQEAKAARQAQRQGTRIANTATRQGGKTDRRTVTVTTKQSGKTDRTTLRQNPENVAARQAANTALYGAVGGAIEDVADIFTPPSPPQEGQPAEMGESESFMNSQYFIPALAAGGLGLAYFVTSSGKKKGGR